MVPVVSDADTSDMDQSTTAPAPDYEALPLVAVDRRRCPDRRMAWRGGRRDADWINRPPGVLARAERSQRRRVAWQQWRALRSLWLAG